MVRCINAGLTNKIIIINNNNKAIPIDLEDSERRLVDVESHFISSRKLITLYEAIIMLKVLCVCGCGLGSSFAIEMSAKSVLKNWELMQKSIIPRFQKPQPLIMTSF